MSNPLSRACLFHGVGRSHAQTASLALAAAITGAAAGVAKAQSQTTPIPNVRVVLRCNDALASTPNTSGLAYAYRGRIADDGSIEAVIREQRWAAVNRVDDQLIDYVIGPRPLPGVSDNTAFDSQIGVSGRPGHLRLIYQRGNSGLGYAFQDPTESQLNPRAGGPRMFTDGTVRPLGQFSSIVFWFDRSVWMQDETDAFVSVARKGDPAPGYEQEGLILDEPWPGPLSANGQGTFSAGLLHPDGSRADNRWAFWSGQPGAFVPVLESPGPVIPGFESLRLWSIYPTFVTPSGDVLFGALYSDPADDGCCLGAFLSTILVARPGSVRPLVPPGTRLPGVPIERPPSFVSAGPELRDGSIVFHASYYGAPVYPAASGLWLVRNDQITLVRASTDPDLSPLGAFGGVEFLGETDDGALLISTDTRGYDVTHELTTIESWKNGRRQTVFSTSQPIPGHDARCPLTFRSFGMDTQGRVFMEISSQCFPFTFFNPSAPILPSGLYRVDGPGEAPHLVLPASGSVLLADGSTRHIAYFYQFDDRLINRFGQTLIGGVDADTGESFLFILETTALCRADYNADGVLDPDDIGDYITNFYDLHPSLRADVDENGVLDPDDLGDYLSDYFSGCPGA